MCKVELEKVNISITYHSADQHRIRCLKQSKSKVDVYKNQQKLKKQIQAKHYYEDVILKRRKFALNWLRTPKGMKNTEENVTYLTNGASVLVGVVDKNELIVVTAYPSAREL